MPETRARPALIALYHAARRSIDRIPRARAIGRLPQGLPPMQARAGVNRPKSRILRTLARHSDSSLLHALCAAAPHLDWRDSYRPDAFGALFLHRSAWAEIAGPGGAFRCDDLRVTFGIWDRALIYDWHAHAPEELYIPLSGHARICAHGTRPRDTRYGAVHHRPWQAHRLEMGPTPFVAMAVWSGAALSAVSRVGQRG